MKKSTYNPYNPNKIDPNKTKKCSCEDKYGPKPFTNNNQHQNNKSN